MRHSGGTVSSYAAGLRAFYIPHQESFYHINGAELDLQAEKHGQNISICRPQARSLRLSTSTHEYRGLHLSLSFDLKHVIIHIKQEYLLL